MTTIGEQALEYRRRDRPGKIAVVPTKRLASQLDLSLAYTPGVGQPILEIESDPETAYEYTAKNNLMRIISNGAAMLGLGDRGALVGIPFAFFITEDLTGNVRPTAWTRSIGIEALGPVSSEGFLEDFPSDAIVGTCVEKYRHTQDEYEPGAVEVCGTRYTVDTGSGFGEVVQDCVQPIQDCVQPIFPDFCAYAVQEWQETDRMVLEGSDLNPAWPEVHLPSDGGEGSRIELYTIEFQRDDGAYSYETHDAAEYSQYQMGSEWLLKVNGPGMLVSVEPLQ